MKLNILTTGIALCLAIAGQSVLGATYFVDITASGGETGNDWANAYTNLQDALYRPPGSGDEIWVAQGVYPPTNGSDPRATFLLLNGVEMYGGFTGSESTRGARDWESNPTLLSGEIQGDAEPTNNAWHVLTAVSAGDGAVLDGFVITNGYAQTNGSPFAGSSTDQYGGGMYVNGRDPIVRNCTFAGNWANYYGGAILAYSCYEMVLDNCLFYTNGIVVPFGWNPNGTAIRANDVASASDRMIITNCVFRKGASDTHSSIYLNASAPLITDCVFDSSTRNSVGYGIWCIYLESQIHLIRNCTFRNMVGGGIYSYYNEMVVTNCSFFNNAGTSLTFYRSHPNLSTTTNKWPKAYNCTFAGNSGSPLYFADGAGEVRNCIFSGNNSWGILHMQDAYQAWGQPITDCIFSGNYRSGDGTAGIYNYNYEPLMVSNCLFVGNLVDNNGNGDGAAMQVRTLNWGAVADGHGNAGPPRIVNCTFANNQAADAGGEGGALHNANSYTTVVENCIFWGNTASVANSDDINQENGELQISYTDVDTNEVLESSGTVNWGSGILDGLDPYFVGVVATGVLSAGVTFDADIGQSTVSGGSFTVNEHAGRFVNADATQVRQLLIASNSTTTIWAWGDASSFGDNGDSFQVHDYHLRSLKNHYTPAGWVHDGQHSPCIDTGSSAPYGLEPLPNGGVINMGAYGNTLQASKEHIPFGTMFIIR